MTDDKDRPTPPDHVAAPPSGSSQAAVETPETPRGRRLLIGAVLAVIAILLILLLLPGGEASP